MSRPLIIAIDGPAGAGKSTIARRIAACVGAIYIDTGAMYRAIALWAIRSQIPLDDSHRVAVLAQNAQIQFNQADNRVLLNGEDIADLIRTPEVATAASLIAALPAVRRVMVDLQRDIASRSSIVMEGRDIGSVVFPDADIKIYLDASSDIRARRRADDLLAQSIPFDLDALTRQIEERDFRDCNRAASPLMQALDATYLDSSNLSAVEVEDAILKIIRAKTSNGKELVH